MYDELGKYPDRLISTTKYSGISYTPVSYAKHTPRDNALFQSNAWNLIMCCAESCESNFTAECILRRPLCPVSSVNTFSHVGIGGNSHPFRSTTTSSTKLCRHNLNYCTLRYDIGRGISAPPNPPLPICIILGHSYYLEPHNIYIPAPLVLFQYYDVHNILFK